MTPEEAQRILDALDKPQSQEDLEETYKDCRLQLALFKGPHAREASRLHMATLTTKDPTEREKLEDQLRDLLDTIADEIDADFEAHGFPPGWEA
jgi:hypothetical protein